MDEHICKDGLPTYQSLRPQVLRVLSDGVKRTPKEIADCLAERLGWDESLKALLPTKIEMSRFRYVERTIQALWALEVCHLVEKDDIGAYAITETGRKVDQEEHDCLMDDYFEKYDQWKKKKYTSRLDNASAVEEKVVFEAISDDACRELVKQLQRQAEEHNQSVRDQLRHKLQSKGATFFEHVALDLLIALGVGG